MDDRDWNIKCRAAFLALYAAMRLSHQIGLEPEDMLAMLRDKLQEDGCIDDSGAIIPSDA